MTPGEEVRGLIRGSDRAILSTSLEDHSAWPYGSLVLTACDQAATPLLLISELAEHTKNLRRDHRACLLFDGTAAATDPLTGARASVLGTAAPCDDDLARQRFLRRHPTAETYAGFGDFRLWRLSVTRSHLVAGFGQIHWVAWAQIVFDTADAAPLAMAEAEIVDHMNVDHADMLDLYATVLLDQTGSGWRMTGIDPEGCDLRRGGRTARLAFNRPVANADAARRLLVELAKAARAA